MHAAFRQAVLLLTSPMLAAPAAGQSTFLRMYANGNTGMAVREVGGNTYVSAGGTDFYANWHWQMLSSFASTDIHLMKTNAAGTLLWEREIGSPASRTIANWMEPTADGGFIIAGSDGKDVVWPPDSNDVVLVKTDAMGNPAWTRKFDTGFDEVGYCVRPTSDGGYIVSAFHDASPISFVGTVFVLLIKTDANGVVQWEKKIPFAIRDFVNMAPFPYVVRQMANGDYAVVGTGIGSSAIGVYVIRTDALGNVIWAKVYDHDPSIVRYSTGLDLLEHTNGDLIIAGSMDKQQPVEINHPYVLRISASGALLDARFYQTMPALFFQSGFSSVCHTASGGFLFTGMGGYSNFGDQAQLLKTDPALNMLWSRVYTWDGLATMGARSGRPTSDGGFIFTGKRQGAGAVLLKTDALGLIPCKTPNVLTSLVPVIQILDRSPVPIAITNGSPLLFTTITPAVDSTTLCGMQVSVLPIELGSFGVTTLDDAHVVIDWTTMTESNTERFIVERSYDGLEYQEAVSTSGAGASMATIHYSLLDAPPVRAPVIYYRLVQIDKDGTASALHTVSAVFEGSGPRVLGWLPEHDRQALLISSDREVHIKLRIWDMQGRELWNGGGDLFPGMNVLDVGAMGSAPGVLLYRLSDGSRTFAGPIVR